MVLTWTDNTWLWFTSLTFTSVWFNVNTLLSTCALTESGFTLTTLFCLCARLIYTLSLLDFNSVLASQLIFVYHMTFFFQNLYKVESYFLLFLLSTCSRHPIYMNFHTHTVKAIFLPKGFPVVIGSRQIGRRFKRDRIWLTTIGTVLSVTSSTLL